MANSPDSVRSAVAAKARLLALVTGPIEDGMAGEHFEGISRYARHDEQARRLREFVLENTSARYATS
ncbi:hypothetical protein [Pseudonocardia alaniniphila]|uniref:Uncharacterized protein n=1 Tax=Pseudonocardia alaniniphila TaxID=75291 RepID=A0ABS9TUN0_9PSEU|nr:hypothetical protein [Pseudonocardia alaniniphila]MCH6171936.1 hypothetical protein [Pseudonocardia alaniniphila]